MTVQGAGRAARPENLCEPLKAAALGAICCRARCPGRHCGTSLHQTWAPAAPAEAMLEHWQEGRGSITGKGCGSCAAALLRCRRMETASPQSHKRFLPLPAPMQPARRRQRLQNCHRLWWLLVTAMDQPERRSRGAAALGQVVAAESTTAAPSSFPREPRARSKDPVAVCVRRDPKVQPQTHSLHRHSTKCWELQLIVPPARMPQPWGRCLCPWQGFELDGV